MLLPLDQLDPHPSNPNRVPAPVMDKLARHIGASGRYPPLIVRPHPDAERRAAGRFQIIDGHHRAEILRRLKQREAHCEVWDVGDAEAAVLLATLNGLHGEDDPHARGALLHEIAEAASLSLDELTAMLPDEAQRIERLMALARPPARPPAPPPPQQSFPQAVTFFLNEAQRARLFEKLAAAAADRSAALVALLELDCP